MRQFYFLWNQQAARLSQQHDIKNVQSLQCILTWKKKLELEKIHRVKLDVSKMAAYLTCVGGGKKHAVPSSGCHSTQRSSLTLHLQSQRSCPPLAPLERTQQVAPIKQPITKSINIAEQSVSAASLTQHHNFIRHLLQFLSSIYISKQPNSASSLTSFWPTKFILGI